MTKLLLKAAPFLALGFVLLIGLIRAQPYRPNDLPLLLVSPDECPVPCFIGIHPGVTTAEESLAILEEHAWIEALDARLYSIAARSGTVLWDWSGRQPETLVGDFAGSLSIEEGLVQSIDFRTNVSFGNLWLLLGQPQWVDLTPGFPGEAIFFHRGLYLDGMLQARSIAACPLVPEAFWRAEIGIGLRDVAGEGVPAAPVASGFGARPLASYDLQAIYDNPPCVELTS